MFSNLHVLPYYNISGALAAQRGRAPYSNRKENPWVHFLMVIMARVVARGHICTWCNVAAILQMIGWQRHAALVYGVLWCWKSILWSNWHLSKQGIRYPASCDHITGSHLQLIEVMCFFEVGRWPSASFSIWSRTRVCWKQGRIVRKPVTANPGLKVNGLLTFSSIQNFSAALFCVYGDTETLNRRPNKIQKPHCKVTKLKSRFYLFLC